MSTPPSPSGTARPEERLVLDAELVDAADAHVALRVGVAVHDPDRADDVRAVVLQVAVAHRRALGMELLLFGGALHVDDRLGGRVDDDDLPGGAARLLRVLGGDERDGLAVVAHPVDGEHGLVRELEAVGLRARHVVVREHRVDARHRRRGRDVDRDDARVGVRAPQRVPPEHPGGLQVARVRELARHLRSRVLALDGQADVADLQLGLRGHSAAILTASKIFA